MPAKFSWLKRPPVTVKLMPPSTRVKAENAPWSTATIVLRAPMISGNLPLETRIAVAIFDLCFEEFSEGSSCGPAATSVVMAFMQLAY